MSKDTILVARKIDPNWRDRVGNRNIINFARDDDLNIMGVSDSGFMDKNLDCVTKTFTNVVKIRSDLSARTREFCSRVSDISGNDVDTLAKGALNAIRKLESYDSNNYEKFALDSLIGVEQAVCETQKKGIFDTDDVAPFYVVPTYPTVEEDVRIFIRSRDINEVRARVADRRNTATILGVPFHCVPLQDAFMTLPRNLLKCPFNKETNDNQAIVDYRRKAMRKYLDIVKPSVIVTVDAEGGGGVRTYCNMVKNLNRIVVLSFKNSSSKHRIESTYAPKLEKEKRGVQIDVLSFDFSSDNIAFHLEDVVNSLVAARVDFSRDLLMFTFYPGAFPLSSRFSHHFAIVANSKMYSGCRNVNLPPLSGRDNEDTVYLSYFCNQFFLASSDECPRLIDREKKIAVNFSQHCAYADRVSDFSYLRKWKGECISLSRYVDCTESIKQWSVHMKNGSMHNNYEIIDPKCLDLSLMVGVRVVDVSSFDLGTALFMPCSDINRHFYYRHNVDGEQCVVWLPKRSYYYTTGSGDIGDSYYDYDDRKLTFSERRIKLAEAGRDLIDLSHYPAWKYSFVVWPGSNSPFSFIVVDRDILMSGLSELGSMASPTILEIHGVSYCNKHGYVAGTSDIAYYSDIPFIRDVVYDNVKKDIWNMGSKNVWFMPGENDRLRVKRIACDGICCRIVDYYINCDVMDTTLHDLFSDGMG